MKEQPRVFIVEPFGHQEIGKGETRRVLLDGFNECSRVDGQCDIVQHMSEFVLNLPVPEKRNVFVYHFASIYVVTIKQ